MLLSELTFGSFLTYAPRGVEAEAQKSQQWMRLLKNDKTIYVDGVLEDPPLTMSRFLARSLATSIAETPLINILGDEAILVPVPKSSLMVEGGLWVPQRIAEALVNYQLGKEIATIITRIKAVPKAATSAPSSRPKPIDHYNTTSVEVPLQRYYRIVLVDDVITRGATLLGAASRIAEAFPGAEICAFAMIRTISNPVEFVQIKDPCVGKIELHADETLRIP